MDINCTIVLLTTCSRDRRRGHGSKFNAFNAYRSEFVAKIHKSTKNYSLVDDHRGQDDGKQRSAILAAMIPSDEMDELLVKALKMANDRFDTENRTNAKHVMNEVSYNVRLERAMYHFGCSIWKSVSSDPVPEQDIQSLVEKLLPEYTNRKEWKKYAKETSDGDLTFWCTELENAVKRLTQSDGSESQQEDIREVAGYLTAMADLSSQSNTQQAQPQPQPQPQPQSQAQPQQVPTTSPTRVNETVSPASVRNHRTPESSRSKRTLVQQSPRVSKRPAVETKKTANDETDSSSEEDGEDAVSTYSPDDGDENVPSDKQTWLTPQHLVLAIRNVFKQIAPANTPKDQYIQLDPCAAEQHPTHTTAVTAFTKHDDGLQKQWQMADGSATQRVYVNPPFNCAEDWVQKTLTEMNAGRITGAIMLLPLRATAKWWRDLVKQYCWAVPNEPVKFLKLQPTGKLEPADRPCPVEVCFVCICNGTELQAFNDAFKSGLAGVAESFEPLRAK